MALGVETKACSSDGLLKIFECIILIRYYLVMFDQQMHVWAILNDDTNMGVAHNNGVCSSEGYPPGPRHNILRNDGSTHMDGVVDFYC